VQSTTKVKLPGKADEQNLQKAFQGFHCTNGSHPLQAHKGLTQHPGLWNATIYTFNSFLISNTGVMCLRWIELKSDRLAWKMRIISCKTAWGAAFRKQWNSLSKAASESSSSIFRYIFCCRNLFPAFPAIILCIP